MPYRIPGLAVKKPEFMTQKAARSRSVPAATARAPRRRERRTEDEENDDDGTPAVEQRRSGE